MKITSITQMTLKENEKYIVIPKDKIQTMEFNGECYYLIAEADLPPSLFKKECKTIIAQPTYTPSYYGCGLIPRSPHC